MAGPNTLRMVLLYKIGPGASDSDFGTWSLRPFS